RLIDGKDGHLGVEGKRADAAEEAIIVAGEGAYLGHSGKPHSVREASRSRLVGNRLAEGFRGRIEIVAGPERDCPTDDGCQGKRSEIAAVEAVGTVPVH